ncbi:hypothetical protein BX600DRAFT_467681 [Xylariales sp. PMI_506]|nr:hypothetical protein BX600DRAFT_467681 [Xylariales sp. PMI_506]
MIWYFPASSEEESSSEDEKPHSDDNNSNHEAAEPESSSDESSSSSSSSSQVGLGSESVEEGHGFKQERDNHHNYHLSFHLFPLLPAELRIKIWEDGLGSSQCRVIPVEPHYHLGGYKKDCCNSKERNSCEYNDSEPHSCHVTWYMLMLYFEKPWGQKDTVHRSENIRTMSLVNREARHVVLSCYPRTLRLRERSMFIGSKKDPRKIENWLPQRYLDIRFNPKVDALFLRHPAGNDKSYTIMTDEEFDPNKGVTNFTTLTNYKGNLPNKKRDGEAGSLYFESAKEALRSFETIIYEPWKREADYKEQFLLHNRQDRTLDLISFMTALRQVYINPCALGGAAMVTGTDTTLRFDRLTDTGWEATMRFWGRRRMGIHTINEYRERADDMRRSLTRTWGDAMLGISSEGDGGWMAEPGSMPQVGCWTEATARAVRIFRKQELELRKRIRRFYWVSGSNDSDD